MLGIIQIFLYNRPCCVGERRNGAFFMGKRIIVLSCFATSMVAISFLTTNSAFSQGGVKNLIFLQPATPGVQQTGHGNISGTFRAANFIGDGSGLTGVAATTLVLPFTGSAAPTLPTGAFRINSTGTGPAIYATQGSPGGTPALSSAILGQANSTIGVWGSSETTYGVRGQSDSGIGVYARTNTGLYALEALNVAPNSIGIFSSTLGANGFGVIGQANGTGVEGRSLGSGGTGVGVRGTAVDTDGFGVEGIASATTGFNVGVKGESASTTGQGVFGRATDTTSANIGVYGWASGVSGKGVYGLADAATGITIGVHGISSSTSGRGVFGVANSLTGLNYGVYGLSSSPTGFAVYGLSGADSGNAVGVRGDTTSSSGRAVVGNALDTGAGVSFGGYFTSATISGRAIYGEATGTLSINYGGVFTSAGLGGYGIRAENTNTGASPSYGVYGEANGSSQSYGGYFLSSGTASRGVYGLSTSATGITYGVRGQTSSATGFGVYSVGDTGASGTKSFVIDHPEDPANKYLRHYSAEGPVPFNIYNGEITTDSKGFAMVQLPDYYASINKNAKIQLTVIDESEDFVMVKVVKRVQNGQFQIRTSKPNVEVFWEVKAERNDAWVQAHPPKVEYAKEGLERGKYQHPELYGMPKQMGMDYRERDVQPGSVRK